MTTEQRSELPVSDHNADAKRRALFIGAGIVLVSLAYPDTGIGKLTLRYLLKDHVHLTPDALAGFFVLANIPSWCKPLLGILSDSVPLFGTRRRYYVMIAGTIGVLLWGVMSLLPHQYVPLLVAAIALNAMATVGGTMNGAVLVEEGQRRGTTGSLVSLRSVCSHTAAIGAGYVSGWLASRAFGLTCAVGGLLMASLVALGAYCLREPRSATRNMSAWTSAQEHFFTLINCRPLWAASALMFLATVAPGFSTPLFYHQTDKLGFSAQFIGLLASVASICSVCAGVVYFFLCRHMNLRHSIMLCIALNALGAFLFVFYQSQHAAILIEGFYGLTAVLGFLALFDLAARATPKGSEALGYSILYAFINIAMGFSDWTGSKLYVFFHQQFTPLVWINGGTTAAILLFVPLLPAILVNRKDGERKAA